MLKHEAPASFPQGKGAGADRRAETHLLTVAGGFQDASLDMKISDPEHHGDHFSPLRSSKMGGEMSKGKRMGLAGRLLIWCFGFFFFYSHSK